MIKSHCTLQSMSHVQVFCACILFWPVAIPSRKSLSASEESSWSTSSPIATKESLIRVQRRKLLPDPLPGKQFGNSHGSWQQLAEDVRALPAPPETDHADMLDSPLQRSGFKHVLENSPSRREVLGKNKIVLALYSMLLGNANARVHS